MKKTILALCAIAMVFSSCCQKPVKKDIGLQLYSVRSLIGSEENYVANHDSVYRALAAMGYTTVEAAKYDGKGKIYFSEPEQLKADLEAAGLTFLSTHTAHGLTAEQIASKDFSEAMEWWKVCVDAHKRAGAKYIVIPSMTGDIPTLAELQVYCDYYNEIGKLCAEQGLQLGYHNHSFEFKTIEDKCMYDYMIENTDPQYVFFEMDVYWATRAGASPVDYFNRYPGRFALLHIKDWKEVGQSGMVGFDAIFNNIEKSGCKHIIVEAEGSGVGDIMKTCEISANYLIEAPFVKASYAE